MHRRSGLEGGAGPGEDWFAALAEIVARFPGPGEDFPDDDDEPVDNASADP